MFLLMPIILLPLLLPALPRVGLLTLLLPFLPIFYPLMILAPHPFQLAVAWISLLPLLMLAPATVALSLLLPYLAFLVCNLALLVFLLYPPSLLSLTHLSLLCR